MSEKQMPVSKASSKLGVTPHYIRKLLREGKLQGEQNEENGRWSVDVASLENFRSTDLYKQDVMSMAKEMKITIKEAVMDVEDNFNCNLISYISFPSPVSMIDQNDCMLLDELLYTLKDVYEKGSNKKKYKSVGLFLHSGGGILEAAIKFVDIIRQYAEEYYVIVPIMAKSAATVMVLNADKQYFTSLSELGPVDPIVQSPTNPNLHIPATAIDNFLEYCLQKNKATSSTVQSPQIDPFILKKLEENFDPFLLGAHKTALKFSIHEVEKALKEHAMKNEQDPQKIKEALDEFTVKHDSHSYPITYTQLQKFGIGEKIEDDDKLKSVKTLMGVYQQFMINSNIVKLLGNREENKNLIFSPVGPSQQVPTKTSL